MFPLNLAANRVGILRISLGDFFQLNIISPKNQGVNPSFARNDLEPALQQYTRLLNAPALCYNNGNLTIEL